MQTEVKELKVKLDEVHQTVLWLKERVTQMEAREAGKIRTNHPYIVRTQGVCGGRPIIEGTRLSVKLIVGWVRIGMTPEEIVVEYPHISLAQVADALAYYEDHPEEIEAEFAEEKRFLELELPRLQAIVAQRNK